MKDQSIKDIRDFIAKPRKYNINSSRLENIIKEKRLDNQKFITVVENSLSDNMNSLQRLAILQLKSEKKVKKLFSIGHTNYYEINMKEWVVRMHEILKTIEWTETHGGVGDEVKGLIGFDIIEKIQEDIKFNREGEG